MTGHFSTLRYDNSFHIGMIPKETVSLIRERTDIVEIIGEFVELRRAGSNFKGHCPFHQEKTPSFNVNPNRQMFHCFGCGAGGDVITFLMNYEGRTFSDAVKTLGSRLGITVEEKKETYQSQQLRKKRDSEKERLLEVLQKATHFYQDRLNEKDGEKARKYLDDRGISAKWRKDFDIGYAPNKWDALVSSLKSLGISKFDAEKVGLIVRKKDGKSFYDRMRDRIVFPVRDTSGRVVAFGGRILPGADSDAPKYINSPESPVFSKSKTVYGLHHSRQHLRHNRMPIIVEGFMDVLGMHIHGFTTAVASMGTALTEEQVSLLRRFSGQQSYALLLFDGDEAGQKAAKRAQPALSQGGLGAKIAILPPSEDPDSYLRRNGQKALRKIIDEAQGLIEYLIDKAAERYSGDAQSTSRGIRSLQPMLDSVKDPMERDLYKRTLAEVFDVSEALVFRYLRAKDSNHQKKPRQNRPEARIKVEGAAVGALLDFPELFPEAERMGVLNLVEDQNMRWVLENLRGMISGEIEFGDLMDSEADQKLVQRVRARLVSPQFDDIDTARGELAGSLTKLQVLADKKKSELLQQEIRQANLEGDKDRGLRLAQEKLQRKRAAGEKNPDQDPEV